MLRQKDYPKTLRIGDTDWSIKFFRKPPDGKKDTAGLCDGDTQTIYLTQGQKSETLFKIFLHELLHAIEYSYEIDIPHKLIYKLEQPLADFIIENLF